MIKAVIVINAQGKVRLAHFYERHLTLAERHALVRRLHAAVSAREEGCVCNFVDDDAFSYATITELAGAAAEDEEEMGMDYVGAGGDALRGGSGGAGGGGKSASQVVGWPTPDTQIIYRRYATLVFIFVTDNSESPLAVLDLIQVFVESLDRIFKNICELDLIFNAHRALLLLQSVIDGGGAVAETSRELITRHTMEQERLANERVALGASATAAGVGASGSAASGGYGRTSGYR